MGYIFKCEKCKKEVDVSNDDVESRWFDDDENGDEHLWLVYWKCPNCGYKSNYEEFRD